MDPNPTKIYIAVIIIIVIIILILFLFIRTIRIHHKKLLLSYKNQVKTEITTLEAERKRMAADLHDDLGPFLSSLKLQLNLLDVHDEADQKMMAKIKEGLSQIIQKIRETSNDLLPNILIRDGVIGAIQVFAERINDTRQLSVETNISIQNTTLPPLLEVHLFRIFQEALNNCIKHAEATHFIINLYKENGKLILQMHDNGKGVEKKELNKALGMGFRNILSRTDILGGDVYIETSPGKGLQYNIEIPLVKSAII
jgi:two-component system, NarL family, sensor kinase